MVDQWRCSGGACGAPEDGYTSVALKLSTLNPYAPPVNYSNLLTLN